ncbi:MAG: cryptochrome/photolyase family protein, partial [Burkholderiales bacterium]
MNKKNSAGNSPKRHLILVLGDQLDLKAACFDQFDRAQDLVWMAEVREESTHVSSSKQRIAVFLSAMRHFAKELETNKIPLSYTSLTDPQNLQTLASELSRSIQ